MKYQVIRKSNIGDYGDPVIWEAVLEEFDDKDEAENYKNNLIKERPYLRFDRLYIREVE
jgi:hypothetical protein